MAVRVIRYAEATVGHECPASFTTSAYRYSITPSTAAPRKSASGSRTTIRGAASKKSGNRTSLPASEPMQQDGDEEQRIVDGLQRVLLAIGQVEHRTARKHSRRAERSEFDAAFEALDDHHARCRVHVDHLSGRKRVAEDFEMIGPDEGCRLGIAAASGAGIDVDDLAGSSVFEGHDVVSRRIGRCQRPRETARSAPARCASWKRLKSR